MAVNSVPRSGFQAKRGKAENDKVGFRADCCAELWSATEVEPTSQSATEVEPVREQCEHCDRVINSKMPKSGQNHRTFPKVSAEKDSFLCRTEGHGLAENHGNVTESKSNLKILHMFTLNF